MSLAQRLPRVSVSRAVQHGFCGAVGNTPLIFLSKVSAAAGVDVFAKAEFMQPGGSVKDRAALGLVAAAETSGELRPGGTVVEGTAGNTGIGLAHVARARSALAVSPHAEFKCVIFMPETQASEKINLLRMLGADVRLCPAVPFEDPRNYNNQAKAYAASTEGAVWMNQFDNTANSQTHFLTTGPEIARQLPDLDAFVCATGTGGTLAGVAAFLKSAEHMRAHGRDRAPMCFLADPPGSVLYAYITRGVMERTGETSITEGIGQGRVTANLAPAVPLLDGAVHVADDSSIEFVYRLLDQEGLFVGASSALNVAAAVQVGEILKRKHGLRRPKVVTVLCDGANRYMSRLFSKEWLKQKGLFGAVPIHLLKFASLP